MTEATRPLTELLGESREIAAVREKVALLLTRQRDAGRLPPVLIQGETGTGKTALARAIHRAGPRSSAQFIPVNCAAIPDTLLEDQLFGHERGAFTDARQARAGLFQAAHRGTIFLDEIGLLPEALQSKLLQVIEERAVRRLGSNRSEAVDVALLTATAEDLPTAVRARRFREDLYHRIAVVTLALPPLRDRGADIVLLAEHFLARACAEYQLAPKTIAADARRALLGYHWPGNVREIANVMERVALLGDDAVVTAGSLGLGAQAPREEPPAAPSADELSLDERVKEHLREVLEKNDWNISRAAALLGIARNTLRARIEKYGLRAGGPPARRVPRPAAAKPAATPAPSGPLRWEPRRLTLLRAAVRVPEALESQLYASRAVEVLVEKIQSFGGRVEELSPTAVLAAFGLEPTEDAAARAAHAAMAIVRAAAREHAAPGESIAATVAIHVGQFLVARTGAAVEIDLEAKRHAWATLEGMLAEAEPGTIVASAPAAPFLERRFDLTPGDGEGEDTASVYRLDARDRTGFGFRRRMADFVGRGKDLDALRSRLESAMAGRAQVVGIVGEAGMGKSRLVYEFRQSLRGQPVTWGEGRCVSYGASLPYLPILDIVRHYFRITEADSADSIAAKVRGGLAEAGVDADESGPFLLRLLGVPTGSERIAVLSPEAVKTRTFETLRQLSLAIAREHPIVYVIEDLHWIDRTSEECIAFLVESLAGTPILLVTTARPGYRPSWIDKSYATQLALQPLTPAESRSIVTFVLRGRELPEPLVEVILDKAEGNPFFLEELSRTVEEQGELRPALAVPDTVQEVLLARVDRLAPDPKRLLQTAAVLGREVSLRLLGAIWEGGEDVEPHLRELMRLEFLYERTRTTEPVLAFKHALTQEVAYESLLDAHRQVLHARAVRAFEVLYADRLDEIVDRLAYHASRAGDAGKAVEYLTRIATKAARGHAHAEAVSALGEALAHAERLPAAERARRRLDLAVRRAASLTPLGRIREVHDLLRAHETAVETAGDDALVGHYWVFLGRVQSFLGEHEDAVRSAERAIEAARRVGDGGTVGRACALLAVEDAYSGEAVQGIEHGEEAVRLLAGGDDRPGLGLAYWIVGLNHARLGAFASALAAEARGLQIGEEIGDRRLQALALWATGNVHAATGEWHEGIAACQRSVERSPDPLNSAIATGWLGYAYLEQGDWARAIPILELSTRQLGEFGFRQFHGWFTVFLAEAYRLKGERERALETALGGHRTMSEARFSYGIGWAERTLGRIAQDQGDTAGAARHLETAREAFAAGQARYDIAVTDLDRARLAWAGGTSEDAALTLGRARELFQALGLPRWVERVDQEARALGLA